MTVQWTLAAGFLYAEIGVLLLFCLPFVSAKRQVLANCGSRKQGLAVRSRSWTSIVCKTYQSFWIFHFRWNQIFNSRIVATLFEYGNFYFNVVVIVMALLLAGKKLSLRCVRHLQPMFVLA